MPRPERSWDLSEMQMQLADLLARTDRTVPLIARRRDVSASTTRYRVQKLYERLAVRNRRGRREVWLDYEFAPVEVES